MLKEKNLRNIMYGVTVVWVLAQVVLILIYWGKPQHSDPSIYSSMALCCFQKNSWYPMPEDVYSLYIWAPGFINYLVTQLHCFGTIYATLAFNLIMNIGIAAEIYFLGNYFFSKRTAMLSVIFYCLLYSNLMIVIPISTEIVFLFLSLSGFSLILKEKTAYLIAAGFLFALANWVRPMVIVFIGVSLLFMFIRKYKIRSYLSLLLPLIVVIFAIGMWSYAKTGYFVYQSSTSGNNLVQTANDQAYGGPVAHLIRVPNSALYIEHSDSITFVQKDSIWKSRAYHWIKKHPVRFAGLYFKKIAGLYIEDSWADRPIFGGAGSAGKFATGEISTKDFVTIMIGMGLKSLVYYLVLIIFVLTLIFRFKDFISSKGYILLILVLGTLLTCIFPVTPRYHYPFLFALVICSAYGVDAYFTPKIDKKIVNTLIYNQNQSN
jgi:hypothetical protein